MMDAPAPTVTAVTNLHYAIGGRTIIHDLSFAQKAGEHLLLLGASGVGKTSLINLLTGLATPDKGSVSICGEDMATLPGAGRDDLRRRTTGIIFQTLRLISALSVRNNLRLAQRLATGSVDDSKINGLIDAVGITHRADARPRQLSQGEAQRAAIARALVGKPRLIVADEPTSALDDHNAEIVAKLLLDRAEEEGATLLIATHDQRLKAYLPNSMTLQKAD
jgi:putative ABC transport system ATP-binding protein